MQKYTHGLIHTPKILTAPVMGKFWPIKSKKASEYSLSFSCVDRLFGEITALLCLYIDFNWRQLKSHFINAIRLDLSFHQKLSFAALRTNIVLMDNKDFFLLICECGNKMKAFIYCLSCKWCNQLYIGETPGKTGWSYCQAPLCH